MKFSDGFWLRRQARENFRVFRAIIPSQSTNFNPKICTWLELGGGSRPPRPPPLATRMKLKVYLFIYLFIYLEATKERKTTDQSGARELFT